MIKRTNIKENALRLNFVYKQLNKGRSRSDILNVVIEKYGISLRQGQRYLSEAEKLIAPKVVPELKTVLTVNLPISLIKRIRLRAKEIGVPLSELVRIGLESCLKGGIVHGKKRTQKTLKLSYEFDRLSPKKLEMVYQVLVPKINLSPIKTLTGENDHVKYSSYICTSIV